MMRYDLINRFIQARGFQSYLEVGVNKHSCFDHVEGVLIKESVDPDPNADPTYLMTSDEFWKNYRNVYDIIFIDGLHHGDQVYRDILGAINHAAREDSIIILHDCNPPDAVAGRHFLEEREDYSWNGDVWTGFTYFRMFTGYLTYTLDADEGCGVIDLAGKRQRIEVPRYVHKIYEMLDPRDVNYLSYELLRDYRKELLGLIPEEALV